MYEASQARDGRAMEIAEGLYTVCFYDRVSRFPSGPSRNWL